jgi:hypothetical protein
MLENYEKNNKYILKIWAFRGAVLISFVLNIKKDLISYFLLASGIIILNDCDQVCNYSFHYLLHFQEVILCRIYFK